MFDRYFCARVVARLRADPDAGMIETFLCYLDRCGHSRTTVQRYIREVEVFLSSLRRHRRTVATLVEDDAHRFACRQRRPRCQRRSRGDCAAALRHLIRHLRERGHVPLMRSSFSGHIERVVEAFDAHLRDVVGLAPATRLYRRRYTATFLRSVFGSELTHWPRLRPAHARAFIAEFARAAHGAAARVAGVSLRSFFRWLQFNGHNSTDLASAVPLFRQWRHAALPSVLSDEQYRAFLATFDRRTTVGRRDHALCICMGDLGLRASEAADLMIDDVDETTGTLRIAAGKTRRGRVLPMPKRVQQAIFAYIHRGRAASADRHLFLRHRAPDAGFAVSSALVRGVIRRAFASVAGCERQTGTHILRHTAATRLHRAGADIKRVADVLGHRSIDTAAIYAKVDFDRLCRVALPWPSLREVRP